MLRLIKFNLDTDLSFNHLTVASTIQKKKKLKQTEYGICQSQLLIFRILQEVDVFGQ